MNAMNAMIAAVALCLLGACGSTQKLQPRVGEMLPPKAAAAQSVPTPDQLLIPDSQSRPQRTDEALRKSEKRKPDQFDLPPPG
jgi:hypothetical protein